MTSIAANLQAVRARIATACLAAGRPAESVQLLAVSKTWPAASVREAVAAGQRAFGENYVQEGAEKALELAGSGLEWHFIGPLQSNKTRLVAENFAWMHSVDRLKVAERLAAQRPPGLAPLQVCIQVNVSGEVSKSGCAPGEAATLARAVATLPNIRLRGLMAIPEPTDDTRLLRGRFAVLRDLRERLNAEGMQLDTLSMGMSHDLEDAIMEGATLVRVGTAIFGERIP
ncbi:MAG: YggS family pyridoxal phosphate-dependent enzyme [Rhodocyclales bacterium]|jgi:pyridoxal phosphate enzyme (YggS family)|nr:YggS family pyridoxal phosphate-dependent enzyme [Rhodocyclales bacterium]